MWCIPDNLDQQLHAMLDRLRPNWREEQRPMSIQIRDMANPAAQVEVRQRIRGLIAAAYAMCAKEPADGDADPSVSQRLREEVQAMHIALIGYAPTGEQLAEAIPE